jgi:alpha-D-xyloside xylohydrolase
MPYWTSDTGGYTMQDKFSTAQMKPEDQEEWRELNVRWFQFSTFGPILRVHGELRNREMWELGEGSPAYQAQMKFDRLRYRMFPYIYSLAASVNKQDASFLRALVMDFPGDPKVADLRDEYMFGKAFLVAPVTEYKARTREVYLPTDAVWYDFWSGDQAQGGTQTVPAPYDSMPVYVRAGSIVPFGPDQQYVMEHAQDPITLYVYSGADGDFRFYEDDGLTYGYEKGASAEIPMHWDDTSGTLTLGKRMGSFPGMLSERTFRVVFVSKDSPAGFSFEPKAKQDVNYKGEEVSLKLKD